MEDPRDDATLVAAFRAGEAGAFSELVWRHQHRVRAFVAGLVLVADEILVDDISQETFIAAHRNLATWDVNRSTFSTWLLGIARLRAATALRDQARRRRRFGHALEDSIADAGLALLEGEADEQHGSDRIAALQGCLESLPAHIRQLVLARYVERQDYDALARATTRTETALRMALCRARSALRTCIERRLSGPEATA